MESGETLGQFYSTAFICCSFFPNIAGLCLREENSTGIKGRSLPLSTPFAVHTFLTCLPGAAMSSKLNSSLCLHMPFFFRAVLSIPGNFAISAAFLKI